MRRQLAREKDAGDAVTNLAWRRMLHIRKRKASPWYLPIDNHIGSANVMTLCVRGHRVEVTEQHTKFQN